MAANPKERLSDREIERLRELTARARELQEALRLFAADLPPAPEEAEPLGPEEVEREIVRSRIECVVNDYLPIVIKSLDAALADAEPEAAS